VPDKIPNKVWQNDFLYWLKQQDIIVLVQIQMEISNIVSEKLKSRSSTPQLPEVRPK
jgi:hypothetical protein